MTIQEAIRQMAKRALPYLKVCKVTNVDDEKMMIDCEPVDGSAELLEVLLLPIVEAEKYIVMFPRVDSFVVIGNFDENNEVVLMVCDIDKLFIKIQDFELELKEGNLKVKGKKVEGDFEEITFNGGENGGLTITPELKKQLDKSKARIDGIIDAINKATATPQDGGVGLQFTMVAALNKLADKEDYGNIENGKIKH